MELPRLALVCLGLLVTAGCGGEEMPVAKDETISALTCEQLEARDGRDHWSAEELARCPDATGKRTH